MLKKVVSCLSMDALLELRTAVYLADMGLFGSQISPTSKNDDVDEDHQFVCA